MCESKYVCVCGVCVFTTVDRPAGSAAAGPTAAAHAASAGSAAALAASAGSAAKGSASSGRMVEHPGACASSGSALLPHSRSTAAFYCTPRVGHPAELPHSLIVDFVLRREIARLAKKVLVLFASFIMWKEVASYVELASRTKNASGPNIAPARPLSDNNNTIAAGPASAVGSRPAAPDMVLSSATAGSAAARPTAAAHAASAGSAAKGSAACWERARSAANWVCSVCVRERALSGIYVKWVVRGRGGVCV